MLRQRAANPITLPRDKIDHVARLGLQKIQPGRSVIRIGEQAARSNNEQFQSKTTSLPYLIIGAATL